MTKDEITPILLAGFLAGGIIMSAFGVETTNHLRQQVTAQAMDLENISTQAHGLNADFVTLRRHMIQLTQRWEDDIQTARRGPRMVGQPAIRAADE